MVEAYRSDLGGSSRRCFQPIVRSFSLRSGRESCQGKPQACRQLVGNDSTDSPSALRSLSGRCRPERRVVRSYICCGCSGIPQRVVLRGNYPFVMSPHTAWGLVSSRTGLPSAALSACRVVAQCRRGASRWTMVGKSLIAGWNCWAAHKIEPRQRSRPFSLLPFREGSIFLPIPVSALAKRVAPKVVTGKVWKVR